MATCKSIRDFHSQIEDIRCGLDAIFTLAVHDALTFCASPTVDFSVINGRMVVKDGQLLTVDVPMLVERHNQISRSLINGD